MVALSHVLAFLIAGAVPAPDVSASEPAPMLGGWESPPGVVCTVQECPEVNPEDCEECTKAEKAVARVICTNVKAACNRPYRLRGTR